MSQVFTITLNICYLHHSVADPDSDPDSDPAPDLDRDLFPAKDLDRYPVMAQYLDKDPDPAWRLTGIRFRPRTLIGIRIQFGVCQGSGFGLEP